MNVLRHKRALRSRDDFYRRLPPLRTYFYLLSLRLLFHPLRFLPPLRFCSVHFFPLPLLLFVFPLFVLVSFQRNHPSSPWLNQASSAMTPILPCLYLLSFAFLPLFLLPTHLSRCQLLLPFVNLFLSSALYSLGGCTFFLSLSPCFSCLPFLPLSFPLLRHSPSVNSPFLRSL